MNSHNIKLTQSVAVCIEIGTSLSLCKFVSFCLGTCCCDLAISIVRYDLKQKAAVTFRFDALQLLTIKVKQLFFLYDTFHYFNRIKMMEVIHSQVIAICTAKKLWKN